MAFNVTQMLIANKKKRVCNEKNEQTHKQRQTQIKINYQFQYGQYSHDRK
jgi:hypothetical protein